jgi:hypothetical protein
VPGSPIKNRSSACARQLPSARARMREAEIFGDCAKSNCSRVLIRGRCAYLVGKLMYHLGAQQRFKIPQMRLVLLARFFGQ